MFKSLKTTRTNNTPAMKAFNDIEPQQWRMCYNNECCRKEDKPADVSDDDEPVPQYTETFNGAGGCSQCDKPTEDSFIVIYIIVSAIVFVLVMGVAYKLLIKDNKPLTKISDHRRRSHR